MRYSCSFYSLDFLFLVMEFIYKWLGYRAICHLTFSYHTMPCYLFLDLIYIINKILFKFKTTFLSQSETCTKFGISIYPTKVHFPECSVRLGFVYLSWRAKSSLPIFATLREMIPAQPSYFKMERKKSTSSQKTLFRKAALMKCEYFLKCLASWYIYIRNPLFSLSPPTFILRPISF